jgi:hypothetical protein
LKRAKAFIILNFILLFISCGLETYVFFNPVEIINVSGVTNAIITLPSGQDPLFRNYMIYYRIYLTDIFLGTFSGTVMERNNVNTQLASHYATMERYTSNDNISPTAIDTVLKNLGYHALFVTTDGINGKPLHEVLNAVSGTIWLDFTDAKNPSMQFPSGVYYDLFRSNSFESRPNRLFAYSDELAGSIISKEVNTDVQQRTGSGSTKYAYVSMYLLATGSDNNYAPLYSRPSHIGIFQLPR